MRSFVRNLVAMRQMKTKLRCLKPHRPYTLDFAIDARERVKENIMTDCESHNRSLYLFNLQADSQYHENDFHTVHELVPEAYRLVGAAVAMFDVSAVIKSTSHA